jgi:tetratricopeptide (TPR) repeat protein
MTTIQFRGKSYTLEDASALAIKEHKLGNSQVATEIYHLIISRAPDHADAYNNRSVVLHSLMRYDEALICCNKAVALKPDFAKAHNNRGVTLHALKRYDEALASYDNAIALKPDYAEVYSNRGITLQDMTRYDEALASYDKAIALKPDYAEAHNNRGNALHSMKKYDEALASYDNVIALKPNLVSPYCNRGITLVGQGNMPDAEKMFHKALAISPDCPNALFNLTQIREYRTADCEDAQKILTLLKTTNASRSDRDYLYFSLGKIYDDCGLYDKAFECYQQANQIFNATVSYKPDQLTALTDSIIDVFSRHFLAQSFSFASSSRQPLFIVGMPRSGTTLMASILSNHRSVDTAGELPTIIDSILSLPKLIGNGMSYPQAVKHLTPAIATQVINNYEQRLRRDSFADAIYIIDKQPLNFRHLGFISMLFPKARIIHCTRHPLDTGLSNYFQRFSMHYQYAFDLRNIGHFYGEYEKVMEHWRQSLPQSMIEIRYEDMISNTEEIVRKALDLLGLEWDEHCLAPHTNPCAVETASKWQVRQPIYNKSVGRWRHYEKHLTPLKEALPRELVNL